MCPVEHDRIRVLHLGSPTGLYGAERWILALVRFLPPELVDSRIGVIKDAPELDAPLCREALRFGLATHEFEAPGKLSLPAIGQIRQYIRGNGIDILHTHGYKTDLIGRLAVAGTSCKIVMTPHGWSINAGAVLKVYEALDRVCLCLADAVVPLSRDLYRELANFPGLERRLHLIENGVDLSEIDAPGEPPASIRNWRADGRMIIGYIGQLIARKRVDTLIEAFRRLQLPQKQLIIVGDGPQQGELELISASSGEQQRTAFLGYQRDRIQILKTFDVFVLPSELEGIPRCLMEAMGAGVPVIASNIPGCRDLVEDGITGLLFDPGDSAALASRLKLLIEKPKLREALARRGRERIQNAFSAKTMARKYLELYDRLRQSAGRPVAYRGRHLNS